MVKTMLLICLLFPFAGCAMFTAWRAIPPPGGCDQCHTVPISNDWTVTYKAPYLTDERNHTYFQTEQYTLPQPSKPASSLEIRKETDLECFACHRSPNAAHKGRKGSFHH